MRGWEDLKIEIDKINIRWLVMLVLIFKIFGGLSACFNGSHLTVSQFPTNAPSHPHTFSALFFYLCSSVKICVPILIK